jgi:hypothetical protein
MTDLSKVKWEPDCGCKIEVREVVITRDFQCTEHRADGSKKDIPLRVATVDEMVAGGTYPKYWADRKERHGGQAKVHVCPKGCVYQPGTKLKGRLTHRCDQHQDLDNGNLQSQLCKFEDGSVTRQITAGEGRILKVVLEQKLVVVPPPEEG